MCYSTKTSPRLFQITHRAQQLSIEVVDVDVVIAIALTGEHHVIVSDTKLCQHVLLDIFLNLVLNDHLTDRRQRVAHIHLQQVLMTIHRHDSHLRRVIRWQQARNIAIGIKRQVKRTRLVRLDVIRQYLHFRVLHTSQGVFIGIVARVVTVLLLLWCQSFEQLHGILRHSGLIVTYPNDLLGVGREDHRRIGGELLLIDPIRNAIDNLIALAILRHLTLGIVVEQLDEVNIVVTNKGYLIAIG